MTEWGKPIEVNGKRPAWLGDDDRVMDHDPGHAPTNGKVRTASGWGWYGVNAFRLPSDHWAYKAIDRGFEPWGGGDSAPDDWDGGDVLRRGDPEKYPDYNQPWVGSYERNPRWFWPCVYSGAKFADIIGYRKKGNTMTNTPADWAIERALSTFSHRGWTAEEVMRRADETGSPNIIAAFARYIEQHEEAPVDPDLAIAREACAVVYEDRGCHGAAKEHRDGVYDEGDNNTDVALAAIRIARERGKL